MPRLELFAFRYRDPRTRKWIRARYAATREEIAQRHAAWEIVGLAEIRDVDPEARYFTPHKSPLDAELRRYSDTGKALKAAVHWRSKDPGASEGVDAGADKSYAREALTCRSLTCLLQRA